MRVIKPLPFQSPDFRVEMRRFECAEAAQAPEGSVECWLLARLMSARERGDVWAVMSFKPVSQDKEEAFAHALIFGLGG